MSDTEASLQDLKQRHPEWEPWLAVVAETLRETADAKWEATVPLRTRPQESKIPLLAEATIALNRISLRTFFERLIHASSQSETAKMSTLEAALDRELDLGALFKASFDQNREHIRGLAASLSADPEAFEAVSALLPVPLLQACNRRWASLSAATWIEGYCPVCGAWPAFAEMRGIERSRYLRCGRCGAEWQTHVLLCPYCGNPDHEQQLSLVIEGDSKLAIDACKRCLGYVKIFTTLQGSPAAKVMVDDLASVELDLAAAERGYRRPQSPGYCLNVAVSESGAPRKRAS